jgi:hypothetical protein
LSTIAPDSPNKKPVRDELGSKAQNLKLTHKTQFVFEQVKSCPIIVNFTENSVTSDAKRRVVVGLAPTDPLDYDAAVLLARDFRKMGVQVIFLNETGLTFEVPEVSAVLT